MDTRAAMGGATSGGTAAPRGGAIDPWIVAAIALAARAVYFVEYRRSPFFDFLHLDPRYYHDWAAAIASGDWLGREVFEQSPLYPYLLAIYFTIFGRGLTLLRILQFALGAVTAALVALLGRRLFGRAAGLVAGTGAALYGPFLFYEGQVMKEFLTPFFSTAALLLVHRGTREGRPGAAALAGAGLGLGLAALVRDNFLLLVPIFAGWLFFRKGAGAAAALAAGAFAALLPVLWRNHAVAGEWVLTTSGGGEVFYIGNGPFANGAYVPPPWVRSNPRHEHEDFRKKAREISGRSLTRSEASRFWYREGLRTILDDPARWARLMVRKALLFVNDHELPDNYSYDSFRRFSWTLALAPTFGWAAALAAPGLLAARGRDLAPLYLAGAGYAASVMIFFNFARFRLPFVPILLVLAGRGAVVLWRSAAGLVRPAAGRPPRGAAALFLLAAAAVFAGTRIDLSSGAEEPFQDRLHLAAAYQEAGRTAEAEDLLRTTIRDAEEVLRRHGWTPGSPAVPGGVSFALALHAAHRDLAEILLATSRTEEAIREMREAIPLDPNDADLYQRLGAAYVSRGDARSAVEALRQGLRADPSRFTLRFDLAAALRASGDPQAAIRELVAAREASPALDGLDLADWHYGMGTVLLDLPGRQAEAAIHLREGLRLNPDHPQAGEVRRLLSSPGG